MPTEGLASYVSQKWSFESPTMQKVLKVTKSNIFEFAKKFDYYKQNIKRGSFERLLDTDKFLKLISDKFQNALLDVEKVICSNSEHFFGVKWKDVNNDIKNELKKFFNKLKSFYNEFGCEHNERTIFGFFGSLNSLNLTRDGIDIIDIKYQSCGKAWSSLLTNWMWECEGYLHNNIRHIRDYMHEYRTDLSSLLETIVETQGRFLECVKLVFIRAEIWLKSIRVQDDRDLSESCVYKIFPNKLPRLEEVKQRYNIGDCYLVSALISIVKQNPKAIRDCFPQSNAELKKANWIRVKII